MRIESCLTVKSQASSVRYVCIMMSIFKRKMEDRVIVNCPRLQSELAAESKIETRKPEH